MLFFGCSCETNECMFIFSDETMSVISLIKPKRSYACISILDGNADSECLQATGIIFSGSCVIALQVWLQTVTSLLLVW